MAAWLRQRERSSGRRAPALEARGELVTKDASKSPTRGQKILRRTIVGGSIALVTAGLITLVDGESGPFIVHGFAALLLVGSLLEASKMAKDPRRASWSLSAAAAAAWMASLGFLRVHSGECDCPALTAQSFTHVVSSAAAAGLLASAVSKVLAPRLGLVALLPLCLAGVWMTSSVPGDKLVTMTATVLLFLTILGLRPGELRQGFRDVLSDCARVLWFVPALASLALLHAEFDQAGLISLIALSKVGDIFGYFGGSLFGKHHPLPRLSPGKTTEGFVCSLLGGVGVGVALAHWGALPGEDVSLGAGALIGAVMNAAAQAGDLMESWVKRRSSVKDSGATFGPSGGFLDLLDSFFFTIPVAIWIGLTGA